MATLHDAAPPAANAVHRLVPFVHVVDVESSLAFYRLLGFSPEHTYADARGRPCWALAKSSAAEIMFARADGPILAEQQAVLFYMYAADVAALRQHLLAAGLHDGRAFHGAGGPGDGRRVVFEVSHPHYMPAGELRITDPDGYTILVGQLS